MKIFDDNLLDTAAIGTAFIAGILLFFKKLIYDVVLSIIKDNLINKKHKVDKKIKEEIQVIQTGVKKRKPPTSIREAEILATLRKSKLATRKKDIELREAELNSLKDLLEQEREIDTKLQKYSK